MVDASSFLLKLENMVNEFYINGMDNGIPLPLLEETDIVLYVNLMRYRKEKEDKKNLQKLDSLGL